MIACNDANSSAIGADPASTILQQYVHRHLKKVLNSRLFTMVRQIKNVGKQCIRQLCHWGKPRIYDSPTICAQTPKKALNSRPFQMVRQMENVGRQCIRQPCHWGGPCISRNVCRSSKHVHRLLNIALNDMLAQW